MKLRLALSNKAGHESIEFEATVTQAAAVTESAVAAFQNTDVEWVLGSTGVVPYYRHADTSGSYADAMDLIVRFAG